MKFATCDLYDEFSDVAGVIGSELLSFGGRVRFSGAAVTIKCFEDNSLVKQVVTEPGFGKVLVVDGGASRRCALLGDMIAKEAVSHGWEGFIIDGCVRDSEVLGTLDIGVKAIGTTPRKSEKRGSGCRGGQIEVRSVRIRDGDRVYADEDGIVVLP